MDKDGAVTKIITYKDVDAVEQIERIAKELNSTRTLKQAMVEMNSIGRIYYENLRRKVDVKIRQFNTTNETKRNIVEQLITAFQTETITIPYDEELIRELQHYAAEKTKTGYTYNGADGVNDDYVMALAMVYDLFKKGIGKTTNNSFRMV